MVFIAARAAGEDEKQGEDKDVGAEDEEEEEEEEDEEEEGARSRGMVVSGWQLTWSTAPNLGCNARCSLISISVSAEPTTDSTTSLSRGWSREARVREVR